MRVYQVDDQNPLFGRALLASQDIARGSVVLSLRNCEVLHAPTKYSVYTGGDRHVDHPVLARLNHSCSPNIFVDTTVHEVVAMRDVAAGEILSFFYPATEWAISHPFVCECGSDPCIGLVAGAAFAPEHVLDHYQLNDHIDDMLRHPELREQLHAAEDPVAR